MGSRPRLKPDFRPLRRGRGAVQLGSSAAAGGIILAGLAPAEIALLDRLDGSLPEEDLYAAAASAGVDRSRAGQLLGLLRTHRVLLTDTEDGGDPGAPRVVVDGAGPLPAAVAALLRAGGVDRVDAGPWAADVADAELRDARRWPRPSPPEAAHVDEDIGPRPALLLLVGHSGLDPRAGDPWRRRGIPVLPVVVDGGRVVIGPVVGTDPAMPCLRCLQLSRIDRDAAWLDALARAAQAAQAAQAPRLGPGGSDDAAGSIEPPGLRADVASVAAGVAAMVAHAALSGDPVPAGVSVEVSVAASVQVGSEMRSEAGSAVAAPWPRLDHRRWSRHPACPAHGPRPGRRPDEKPDGDPAGGSEGLRRGAAGLG